jgi:hypothetical protein
MCKNEHKLYPMTACFSVFLLYSDNRKGGLRSTKRSMKGLPDRVQIGQLKNTSSGHHLMVGTSQGGRLINLFIRSFI